MAETDRKLVFVGGGGHCKAVIDVARSSGRPIMGIIDSNLPIGSMVLGVPVIGNDDDVEALACEDVEFLITVGQIKSAGLRRMLAENVEQAGGRLAAPVIAPTAHIATGTMIGCGTVVMHNAVINSCATVGENVIINTGAIVEHDCTVGDFVHVSTGAIINGTSHVGNDVFVGSHATIANVKTVGDGIVIGAGAVVTNDILVPGIYCGVPAKRIN